MDPAKTDDAVEEAIERIAQKARKLHGELRYDEAILLLQKAIEQYPADSELYTLLASSLWDIGRCDESVAAWRVAIRLWPELECPYLILSDRLRDLGRSNEAIAVLEEGLQLTSKWKTAFLEEMARQYEHIGDLSSAIACYDRALELDPDCAIARPGRKFALERLQEEARA